MFTKQISKSLFDPMQGFLINIQTYEVTWLMEKPIYAHQYFNVIPTLVICAQFPAVINQTLTGRAEL
jgi:hypothetical protein